MSDKNMQLADYDVPEKKYNIKALWGKPKEILRLYASGLYTQRQIADMLDCTTVTINNVIHSALGRQTLEMLNGVADAESIDLTVRYKSLATIALSVQEELLMDESTTDTLKNRIADKIQDRAGYTPIAKNLNVNVNRGLSEEELSEIKQRAREIKNIQFEVVDES